MTKNETTKASLWPVWLALAVGAAICVSITLIGSVLVIGSKLGSFHPAIEWAFYGGLGLVLIWLIVCPFIQVLAAPVVALEDVTSGAMIDHKTLKKVARQLVKAPSLPREHQMRLAGAIGLGSALHEPLSAAINAQSLSATKLIRDHAVLVFASTAISQNGRLDAVCVIVTNLRLVRRLVGHFGYRPPLPELIRIYAHVFMAAVVADSINDLDAEGVLSQLGLSFLDSIPGSRLLIDSAFDGAINAMFTLRVGFVTQRCLLTAGKTFVRSDVRKTANREARSELKNVLREALPAVPGGMKILIEQWL